MSTSLVDSLPRSLVQLCLSYSDAEDLDKVEKVEGYAEIVADVWKALRLEDHIPKLAIFGSELWETGLFAPIGLQVQIEPISVQDKRALIPVLKVLSPQVEGDAGVTIITIPKGLSFNKLVAFAETLTKTHGTIFTYIWNKFREEYGNETVSETYRVVLTNNILKGTRNLSIEAQKKLVDGLGCDFPKVIELCTLLIATLVTSNNHLLNDGPWTLSRCDERIDDWQLHVGGFVGASGFYVCDRSFGHGNDGLVGRFRFKAIKAV